MIRLDTKKISDGLQKVDLRYDHHGEINQIILSENRENICIPKGNDHFESTLEGLIANSKLPEFNSPKVQKISDKDGKLLFFRTDKGDISDDAANPIAQIIHARSELGEMELVEAPQRPYVKSIEISIFLNRSFRINGADFSPTNSTQIDHSGFTDIPVEIFLLHEIEQNYFEKYHENLAFLDHFLRATRGNVVRISISSAQIKKVYKWSIQHVEARKKDFLLSELNKDLVLYKRSNKSGPRTQWYFEWINLQHYLGEYVLEVVNQIIQNINRHKNKKVLNYFSLSELTTHVCIKTLDSAGNTNLMFLSDVLDSHLDIFPDDFTFPHTSFDDASQRVKDLLQHGYYFEALVVAQAMLEGIFEWIFPSSIEGMSLDISRLKWEQKCDYFARFFKDEFRENSLTWNLLDHGLTEIYKIRNKFVHDLLEGHTPLKFSLSKKNEIESLLESFQVAQGFQSLQAQLNRINLQRNAFEKWLGVELRRKTAKKGLFAFLKSRVCWKHGQKIE